MTTIAVDLDDTLYPFGNLARDKFAELALDLNDKSLMRGAYCAWVEWRSPSDVIDSNHWLDIIDRCHENDVIMDQVPFNNSVDTLQALAERGFQIRYISNRSPETESATYQWLDRWDFPLHGHELLCTRKDKIPLLSRCQYLIDDRPKTLVQFVYDYNWTNKYGTKGQQRVAFGLMTEYNRSLTDVPGVYLAPSWLLLRHYLVEKGVLADD